MKQAHSIPLGVEDPDAGVACIAIPGGVEMIELATGRVLWRLDEPLLPLALDQGRVLLRRRDREPYVLTLELRSRRDGRLLAHVAPVSLPFNAELAALEPLVDNDTFIVQWNAPGDYRGAAPPPSFALESAAPASGALRIDAEGRVDDAPLTPVSESVPQPSGAVLSLTGDALEARDAETAEILWQRPITAKPTRRPPPLRP